MRILGGHPDRQLVLEAAVFSDQAARLDRHGRQPLLEDAFLDHHLRLRERVLDRVLGSVGEVPGQVVHLVEVGSGAVGLQALEHVRYRRQWLVFDFDGLGTIGSQLAVVRDDHGDRFTLEDSLLVRNGEPLRNGPLFGHERGRDRVGAAEQRFEVGCCQHGDHAWHGLRGGGIDARDSRVRMWAADDRHRQRARAYQVFDVAPAAGDQMRVLAAMDASANHLADGHGLCPPQDRLGRGHASTGAHHLARGLYGAHDVGVTGTPAQIAFETLADLVLGRARVALQQRRRRHEEARRAETALQSVLVPERFLQRREFAVAGQALDRCELSAIRLDGEHRAGFDRSAVDEYRAGTALAGVAADMRAGQTQVLAQEIHEQIARLDVARVVGPVHVHAHGYPVSHSPSLSG